MSWSKATTPTQGGVVLYSPLFLQGGEGCITPLPFRHPPYQGGYGDSRGGFAFKRRRVMRGRELTYRFPFARLWVLHNI